jgi:membrane protease YdiL (CAAX protease family)
VLSASVVSRRRRANFCLRSWYTKSLWWAIGLHAGWDWGQSFFYGVPNGGWIMKGHFLAAHATGHPLYSGTDRRH